MKKLFVFALLFVLVGFAAAGDKAMVVAMRSTCGGTTNGSSNRIIAAIAGSSDGGPCTEYLLRTSKVEYHVRPQKDVLLPVGEYVEMRLDRREVLIRLDDAAKDVRCAVVGMELLSEKTKRESARFSSDAPTFEAERRDTSVRTFDTVASGDNSRLCLSQQGDAVPCSQQRAQR